MSGWHNSDGYFFERRTARVLVGRKDDGLQTIEVAAPTSQGKIKLPCRRHDIYLLFFYAAEIEDSSFGRNYKARLSDYVVVVAAVWSWGFCLRIIGARMVSMTNNTPIPHIIYHTAVSEIQKHFFCSADANASPGHTTIPTIRGISFIPSCRYVCVIPICPRMFSYGAVTSAQQFANNTPVCVNASLVTIIVGLISKTLSRFYSRGELLGYWCW